MHQRGPLRAITNRGARSTQRGRQTNLHNDCANSSLIRYSGSNVSDVFNSRDDETWLVVVYIHYVDCNASRVAQSLRIDIANQGSHVEIFLLFTIQRSCCSYSTASRIDDKSIGETSAWQQRERKRIEWIFIRISSTQNSNLVSWRPILLQSQRIR